MLRAVFTRKRANAPCVLVAALFAMSAWLAPTGAYSTPKEGIIGPESRVLLSRFDPSPALNPKKLREKMRATQRMVCEDQAATANLVHNQETVITVAHLLVRPDGSRRNIKNCVFIVDQGGKAVRYAVRPETMRIGNFRGADRRAFGLLDIVNDWMVMRLARPVPGIRPYGLATPADGAFYPEKAVTTVTALADNWPSKREAVRLAERCRLQNQLGGLNERHAVIIMDCDVGFGSSGGAVLVGLSTDRPRLLGLLTDFKEEGDCKAFDAVNCFSAGVATKSILADAIRSVGEIRSVVRKKKRRSP